MATLEKLDKIMEKLPAEDPQKKLKIEYPYLPEGCEIKYVPADNVFMAMAKEYARGHSLDTTMPGAAVVVLNNEVVGIGANGSDYHKTHVCERVRLGSKTGEGYELCEGCHPKNHSERKAISNSRERGALGEGSDLYLWGHWWCCEPCWQEMLSAGIKNVYLMEGSEKLFNKNDPENIVGRQFEEK